MTLVRRENFQPSFRFCCNGRILPSLTFVHLQVMSEQDASTESDKTAISSSDLEEISENLNKAIIDQAVEDSSTASSTPRRRKRYIGFVDILTLKLKIPNVYDSLAALNQHKGAHDSYVRPTEDIFDLDSPKIKEVQELEIHTILRAGLLKPAPQLGHHSNDIAIPL
jgi:hypothetical protein